MGSKTVAGIGLALARGLAGLVMGVVLTGANLVVAALQNAAGEGSQLVFDMATGPWGLITLSWPLALALHALPSSRWKIAACAAAAVLLAQVAGAYFVYSADDVERSRFFMPRFELVRTIAVVQVVAVCLVDVASVLSFVVRGRFRTPATPSAVGSDG